MFHSSILVRMNETGRDKINIEFKPKRKAKQNNITPKRGSPDPLEEQAVSQDVGMSPVPSSSSLTSDAGLAYRMEFLKEKLEWQEKRISELEKERDFLRQQLSGQRHETGRQSSKKHPTKAAETLPDDEDDSPFISSIRSPQKVIECYDQVLRTFRKVRTMTEAFHRHNIDRGTIVATDCRTSCG
ncbi:uncharacterized protein LOC121681786 isoform X2 [Alosa sapidissima]|uniref:uncharacterized protein LOC121681786 isoform X2 n=1 Tax=Alosa sapidissima TaxID=34773 RepID=UPI001C09373A|nr:uncharacterized protein LOC121681786 isoform X2 [Alosa sapidissima]